LQHRTSIPKILGLLMILVGVLGIAFAVHRLFFQRSTIDGTFERTARIFWLVWGGTSLLGCVAGMRCLQHRFDAQKLANACGLLNVVATLAWVAIVMVWFSTRVNTLETLWAVSVGFVWSLVVVVVLSRPSIKVVLCRRP
jgi:hypothetical protein